MAATNLQNRLSINILTKSNPGICFHLHLANNQAVLSVDGSNSSLHKRGYRPAVGIAPIKETLAAGLMRMTGWDGTNNLVDPLCGSGTLLIEAVSSLLGIASGMNKQFLFKSLAKIHTIAVLILWEVCRDS